MNAIYFVYFVPISGKFKKNLWNIIQSKFL